MKVVYFGSPEIAVGPLMALHEAGHEVVLVVTGADKRRGRGSSTSPTPVKAAAQNLGLRVSDDLADALEVDADVGVVVAYGRIIPKEILDAYPMVNIHFSLLPRWRGAAPVERAILAGDTHTGVCLMAVEEGLDTGGVYRRSEIAVDDDATADQIRARLAAIGAELLTGALSEGLGEPVPQSEDGVTYAHKITVADRQVHPEMTAHEFTRRVRIGGAWTTFRDKRLKIVAAGISASEPQGDASPGTFIADTEIQLRGGVVRLDRVQPEGRQAMDAADWARGARPTGEAIES